MKQFDATYGSHGKAWGNRSQHIQDVEAEVQLDDLRVGMEFLEQACAAYTRDRRIRATGTNLTILNQQVLQMGSDDI